MTERFGLVGLTQVDFGFERRLLFCCSWSLERVVVVNGLSCSDKDEVFLFLGFGDVQQEIVNVVLVVLVVGICLNSGEVKKRDLF